MTHFGFCSRRSRSLAVWFAFVARLGDLGAGWGGCAERARVFGTGRTGIGPVRARGLLHSVDATGHRGPWRAAGGGWTAGRRTVGIVVVVALVCLGLAVSRATAASPEPIPTCTSSIPNCTPPALLNNAELTPARVGPERPYAATPAEAASLHAFERHAVENTLRDHHLPAGDAAAVESWGRGDALAELWGLVVQAIHASDRTPDQRNVVAWLTAVMHRRARPEADAAGWEFLKWAGLLRGDRPIPPQSTLLSMLHEVDSGALRPTQYDANATSGFCKWQPPAPFQSEYTGNVSTPPLQSTAQSWCYGPTYRCVSLLGCNDNQPSYDEFVKYGAADVENARDHTASVVLTAQVASSLGFASAAVGAGIAGVALASTLGPVLTGSALASALLPYAGLVGSPAVFVPAVSGAAAAAAVAAVVAVVIVAVAIATVEGIRIVHGAKVPGQLASLITGAASDAPDLKAMLTDSQKLGGLFGVFTGAALPTPSLKACDNRAPVVVGSGTVHTLCLNAPPIPARAANDPRFLITPKGAAHATRSDTLSWTDQFGTDSASVTTQDTARVSGHWFVTHITDATGNPAPTATTSADWQSLSIHYVGWDGAARTAWLVREADGRYRFLTVADGSEVVPSTCHAKGLCKLSDHIDYIRKDSLSAPTARDYSATVVPAVPTYKAISAGLFNTCAITTEGTVACWGSNSRGQSSPPSGTFKAISAGGYHTCAIRTDDAVACWGSNIAGESSPPSGTFKAISAGYGHTCAIRTDDAVACWGGDNYREASPPSGTFKAVSAGQFHTCGIRTDHAVACWGLHLDGATSAPEGHFRAVSAGRAHNCGIRTDDTVACWGNNSHGQASPPSGTFKAISAGYLHTCGIRTDDIVACWGLNVPGHASPPSGTYKAISAGPTHNCGIRTNDTAACWGSNSDGQSTPPT